MAWRCRKVLQSELGSRPCAALPEEARSQSRSDQGVDCVICGTER